MVEVDDVDRLDRGVGVRVGREERPAGVGEEVHRFLEELEPAHLGHAMVGQQHRNQVAAQLELPQRLQGLGTGLGPHHSVVLAILAPKVPSDRP